MDFDLLRIALLATFLSQLFMGSVIAPRRIYLWRREMWEKYPPEHYPRLYPIGTERTKRLQSFMNKADGVLFCAGALIFCVLLIGTVDTRQIAFLLWVLAMAQILVRVPRFIIDRKILRAYKTAQPPAVRSATFRSWTLGDFVPPTYVVVGIVSMTLAIAVAVLVGLSQQGPIREILGRSLQIFLIFSMDVFYLYRMIRVIFQPLVPRIDPYATNDDVYLSRRRRLRVLFIGSAIFAIVTSIELLSTTPLLKIRYEYMVIGLSALFQTWWLLVSTVVLRQHRGRDLSAYRDPVEPSGSTASV